MGYRVTDYAGEGSILGSRSRRCVAEGYLAMSRTIIPHGRILKRIYKSLTTEFQDTYNCLICLTVKETLHAQNQKLLSAYLNVIALILRNS